MAEKLVISCIKQEMYKSKRFSYSYEDYEDGDKNVSTMVEDIMGDSEFTQLEESFSVAVKGSSEKVKQSAAIVLE